MIPERCSEIDSNMDKKLCTYHLNNDDTLYFIQHSHISTLPFVRMVEEQLHVKAFFAVPKDFDLGINHHFFVGDANIWKNSIYPKIDRNPFFLTFLQNPLDFVIDKYWQIACEIPFDWDIYPRHYSENPRIGFEEFIHDPSNAHWINNYQSSQYLELCEVWDIGDPDRLSDKMKELLIRERLDQMAFIGLVEYQYHSDDMFKFTFNQHFTEIMDSEFPKLKIVDPAFRKELLKPDIVREISKRNDLDQQVYFQSKELFFNRYRMMAHRLEGELHWKRRSFAGTQIVTLNVSEELGRLQRDTIEFFRKLRFRLLPHGSRLEERILNLYKHIRGDKFSQKYRLQKDYLPSPKVYNRWIQDDEHSFHASGKNLSEINYSIVVVTTEENNCRGLLHTIRSCLNITWTNYEVIVIIPDDKPSSKKILDVEFEGDDRVQIYSVDATESTGTSNLRKLIDRIRGEYLLFITSGDSIHQDILLWVSDHICSNSSFCPVDIIYFDEDKFNKHGMRCEPWFKPNLFSPDMLLSVNYLRHGFYRRKLFLENWIEEASIPISSADEWSLAFHCVECSRGKIVHIPQILYHEMMSDDALMNKKDDHNREIQEIEDYLARLGRRNTEVIEANGGAFRATWLPNKEQKVSIVIPTKDKYRVLKRCVNAIFERTNYESYEVILVDTGSSDQRVRQFYSQLSTNPRIQVVNLREEFNYSHANNYGVRFATGDTYLFLNNDTEPLDTDWLLELVRWAEVPEIGIVGGKLLFKDGTIQSYGTVLGMLGHARHVFSGMPDIATSIYGDTNWYRNVTAVTGACMMMRKDVFQKVGGFNTEYKIAFSDVEICLKVREAGYRVLCTPFSRLVHYEGESRSKFVPLDDIKKGLDNLGGFIKRGDPYYNKNLSLTSVIPNLRASGEVEPLRLISQVAYRREKYDYKS